MAENTNNDGQLQSQITNPPITAKTENTNRRQRKTTITIGTWDSRDLVAAPTKPSGRVKPVFLAHTSSNSLSRFPIV